MFCTGDVPCCQKGQNRFTEPHEEWIFSILKVPSRRICYPLLTSIRVCDPIEQRGCKPLPQHQRMAHPQERKMKNRIPCVLVIPTERERRGWIFSILKAEEVDPFIFPGQPLLFALAGMDVVMCFIFLAFCCHRADRLPGASSCAAPVCTSRTSHTARV